MPRNGIFYCWTLQTYFFFASKPRLYLTFFFSSTKKLFSHHLSSALKEKFQFEIFEISDFPLVLLCDDWCDRERAWVSFHLEYSAKIVEMMNDEILSRRAAASVQSHWYWLELKGDIHSFSQSSDAIAVSFHIQRSLLFIFKSPWRSLNTYVIEYTWCLPVLVDTQSRVRTHKYHIYAFIMDCVSKKIKSKTSNTHILDASLLCFLSISLRWSLSSAPPRLSAANEGKKCGSRQAIKQLCPTTLSDFVSAIEPIVLCIFPCTSSLSLSFSSLSHCNLALLPARRPRSCVALFSSHRESAMTIWEEKKKETTI